MGGQGVWLVGHISIDVSSVPAPKAGHTWENTGAYPSWVAEPELPSRGSVKGHSASSDLSWNQGPAVLLGESQTITCHCPGRRVLE